MRKDEELKMIAKEIHNNVYKQFFDFKTSIFLCGAGADVDNSVRKQVDKDLKNWRLSYRYEIVYPEDLFDDLLHGERHHDLLTLENILADSVDAVVLIVESYGATAELGAFASSNQLRKKLVCVVDEKHKKSKSFINYGPIRLLRTRREGEVVFCDYSDVTRLTKEIRSAVSRIQKSTSKSSEVNNVLQAHHYILPCIFLFEPVSRELLRNLVMYASNCDERHAEAITTAALSILRKTRDVVLTAEGYKLTVDGHQHLTSLRRKGNSRIYLDSSSLDKLRVSVLNLQLRGKPLRIHGE